MKRNTNIELSAVKVGLRLTWPVSRISGTSQQRAWLGDRVYKLIQTVNR